MQIMWLQPSNELQIIQIRDNIYTPKYVIYELVPAKAVTFRLRTFAPQFWRVGKRNLVGLCVMTMRNDSLLVFIIFPFPDALLPFFLDFSATSILPDERNICLFKKDQE